MVGGINLAVAHLDGKSFQNLLKGSIKLLANAKSEINALNVFPVLDGDTGTNMYLTLAEAVKEVNQVDSERLDKVIEAIARGSLMGARGNSGVILSQVFSGFANALQGKASATAEDWANAFEAGSEMAYKAVAEPVEGTILTVLKQSAKAAREAADRNPDLIRLLLTMYRDAIKALQQTPEQLKILKESGVVDAGGKGWVVILQGLLYVLRKAEQVELLQDFTANQAKNLESFAEKAVSNSIEYRYCTEFLLKSKNLILEQIKAELTPFGDSLMVVGTGETAKIHIHSNNPGLVLETCLNHGSLHKINISNMCEQNENLQANKSLAIVAVGLGKGINSIMENLGVDIIISGGQTMNPSTEDIMQAIAKAPSDKVIIFPNNKNIIMAAQQAASISKKIAFVMPTISIPQGLSGLLALNTESSFDDNIAQIQTAVKMVTTGEVTTAARDVAINGQTVKHGDIIGLIDGDMMVVNNDLYATLHQLIQQLTARDEELITLYYGAEITDVLATDTKKRLQADFADVEIEIHYGGQPLYQYLISAE